MRKILLGLALIVAPSALSSCMHHQKSPDSNWKSDAMKQCQAETDALKRQTCLDEIQAVEHERNKVP